MVTNGDLPAVVTVDFESFYAQTGRRMLSLAYSLTGSWVDAEDLVQEAYAAAHRRWSVVGAMRTRLHGYAGWSPIGRCRGGGV